MPADQKNAAAVAMANLRTAALTPEKRREIAQKAAAAKWKKVGTSKSARRKAVEAANSARRKAKADRDLNTE